MMALTATATATIFTSGLVESRLTDLKHQDFNLACDEKSWDRSAEPLYYLTFDDTLEFIRARNILHKFATNLLGKSEDINPAIAKIINKNFSKLL